MYNPPPYESIRFTARHRFIRISSTYYWFSNIFSWGGSYHTKLSLITWKSIKSAITRQVSAEVKRLAETERDKIKSLIKAEVNRIAKEEGVQLYKDMEPFTTTLSQRELWLTN